MQEVVSQLSKRLVDKGHSVTVLTSFNENRIEKYIDGVEVIGFKIKGNFTNGIFGETKEYIDYLKAKEFDILTNFAAQQWATDLILPILHELKGKKVFVPTGFSGYYNDRYSEYYLQMRKWILQYDSSVFLSEDYRDINFAREVKAKNIKVIPNGADSSEFNYTVTNKKHFLNNLGIPVDSFVLLTVGSHTGLKGHSEAIKIFKKLRNKNVTLCIVGDRQKINIGFILKNSIRWFFSIFTNKIKPNCYFSCARKTFFYKFSFNSLIQGKKIRNLNLTREDTITLFKSSDLFLFPSNIECSPIVLFECAAAKLPFLCTDVGNSQEIINWTHGGEIIETSKDASGNSHANLIKAINQVDYLIDNPTKRMELANNSYKTHLDQFNWEKISTEYENLYLSLTKKQQ